MSGVAVKFSKQCPPLRTAILRPDLTASSTARTTWSADTGTRKASNAQAAKRQSTKAESNKASNKKTK